MKNKKLHQLDLEVMKLVWKLGQDNVNDVLDNIGRKLAYTTVATTMKHLHRKGFLSYEVVGRTFLYQPLVKESEVSQSMLSDLMVRLFDNSAEKLVNALLENENLDEDELNRLQKLITDHQL